MSFDAMPEAESAAWSSEPLPGDNGGSLWDGLCRDYECVSGLLERLGGHLGTEDEADALLEQQERIVSRLTTHKAMSRRQIAQKLKIVLAAVDESEAGFNSARLLLESAIEDLLR